VFIWGKMIRYQIVWYHPNNYQEPQTDNQEMITKNGNATDTEQLLGDADDC
jgi:hypothetical protein